jgi:5-methylcytosine-specific restriction protein A
MREHLQNILNNYKAALQEPYTNHPVANLIRQTLPHTIERLITEPGRYLIKGSAGAGRWVAIPWVAIFDILITDTAQSGYYPVFLFKDNMTGFYLSLNQGVTEIKEKYKREAKQVLKLKAEDYRAQLGALPNNFSLTEIQLTHSKAGKSKFAGLYEAGNIFAKYYSLNDLQTDAQFHADIYEILKIYEALSYNEGLPTTLMEREKDEEHYKGFEELRKWRFHKRVERNIQLSKKVKLAQGYTCKACSINFQDKYGVLGKEFIEAHHLRPIAQLTGDRVQLDARTDFTVLCSNCHSMIHRLDDPSNLELLKSIIQKTLI